MNKLNNSLSRKCLRKCVGCQKIFERTSLIRIMFEFSSEKVLINPPEKHYGRSVYLCKNDECLKNALKKNKLSKSLKKKMSDKDISSLKTYFNVS